MGLKEQVRRIREEPKEKEEARVEVKRVICGKCSSFISPFAAECPTCGAKFEEKIIEEKGKLKKVAIRIVAKAVEGKEFAIPEVKKIKGKEVLVGEEKAKAILGTQKIPAELKVMVPETKTEELKLKEFTPYEKELIKEAEEAGAKEGFKEVKEWVAEEEKIGEEIVREAKPEEWAEARKYEVREAKEEELKIATPPLEKVEVREELEVPEFEVITPLPEALELPPEKPKLKIFDRLRRKKKAVEFEVVEGAAPAPPGAALGVEFATLGEEFEEIEVYPLIEPYAYARILYNRKEHTRFYEIVEPALTDREREILKTAEDAFTKSVNVKIDELDRAPREHLRAAMETIIKSYSLPVAREEEDKLFYFIERDLLGYGKINVLMKDPNIEDISCDGPRTPIYIYHRRYESMETNIVYEDEHELESYVIRLAQRCGKHISTATPLIDSTLMDGSRVVMTLGKEVSTKGSTFTIRKFREDPFTPPDLVTFRTISPIMLAYIWLAVQYGMSILFVGGTASGKTTTLNAVSLFIPMHMKIVSIEETRELNLPHPNWIPGCTREGFGGEFVAGRVAGEVNMYDLLKAALRERPEYVIVGEIRGSEAYVLFQAMATGHTTYSTMHADSVPGLIHRLENKPIDIPRVMIPSLDAVCIQIQTRVGGRRVRRIKQIIEIIGLDPHTKELLTNEVFRWVPALDDFEFSGKSYVLEKIMVKANIRKDEIMSELKRRQAVIEWMVTKGIRKHNDVARIIMEYQVHPQEILERIKSELGERAL
ncbi:MAG: ATPase, T2SS/T4P/T4SS family [Candidatus Thermoplasmatota archaeon]|nr:ATPase, T2SS/T4P/T4SS family [Candidatus Thermoplasmatota archaeon]